MRRKEGKGIFGSVRLPISKSYINLRPRNQIIRIGVIGALFVTIIIGLNFFLQDASILSNGPLSSNHANLESDCAACHNHAFDDGLSTPNDNPTLTSLLDVFSFDSVRDQNCATCHEKFGDPMGVYTFTAHYLYRSKDLTRGNESEDEVPCFSCHPEHLGKRASITEVSDAGCVSCHPFGSFNEQHKEFAFAAEGLPDSANLKFTHIYHVKQVMAWNEFVDIEKACLECHNAGPDGKNFAPLDFDRHCGTCHLTDAEKTPALQVWNSREPNAPGIFTLEDFRSRGDLGDEWAFRTSTGEFSRIDDSIVKSRIYHEDPWILANLKRLRRTMGTELGLSELLRASLDVPDPHDDKILHKEAIETLRSFITELRSHPESMVIDELTQLNRLLQRVEAGIRDPYTSVDKTKFLEGSEQAGTRLSEEQVQEFEKVVALLTEPCQTCHIFQNGFVARVQTDQRALTRAEFDHRAHIFQRRCLDCHTGIPFLDYIPRKGPLTSERLNTELTKKGLEGSWLAQASGLSEEAVSDVLGGTIDLSEQLEQRFIEVLDSWPSETLEDNSSIQNLPIIEQCQTCHQVEVSSNRCVTCHLFHPNKLNRANLLLYVEQQSEGEAQ